MCRHLTVRAAQSDPLPRRAREYVGFHHDDPYLIAVGINDRDARWHDLYIIDIRTGERRLVYQNTDEIERFILDRRLRSQARDDDAEQGNWIGDPEMDEGRLRRNHVN